jgi:uncharacterized protein (DUF362 family)
MKRRDFLKKGVQAGVIATSALSIPGFYGNYISKRSESIPDNFDMAAIKGGEPDKMFDEAIKTFGGMKSFVKKNQKVLLKPNIGWDVSPERGGNTHPKLVSRVIKHCFDAGAKEVYVFDHTCDDWKRTYQNSGIEKAVKDAGGKIVPGNTENYYQDVEIKGGKKLKSAKVHELVLECDVFINMPILKNHGGTRLSISMKNLMGIVWDRGYWHRNDLHQCIADSGLYRKPDLNIVDAYFVMKQNGPRGVSVDDVVTMKSQIISRDMVAADAAAAKLFGMQPDDIAHIRIADEMKIGTKNLDA